MGKMIGKKTYRDMLMGAALLCAAAALVIWPREGMEAAKEGLLLCANVIIPSLFPFFVLSALVVELGLSRYLGRLLQGIMRPLFRVNGACATALALGFVGGYPVGARTAISLYQNGQCSKTEAERLLAFCNNSGPAFILGVVGAGVFSSSRVGLLLYLTHMAASLCVGVLFRFYKPMDRPGKGASLQPQFQAVSFSAAFTKSVMGGLASVLNICAFVLFFSVTIRMLFLSGVMDLAAGGIAALLAPLGMNVEWAKRLLTGFLEVSSGVATLSGDGVSAGRLTMAAFILGWAGLSVHCQVLAFLGDCGLSMRTYFVGKLLHGLFSAGFMALLSGRLPQAVPVSDYLTEQVEVLAALDFQSAFSISIVIAWGVWLIFMAIGAVAVKKSSGKRRGSAV